MITNRTIRLGKGVRQLELALAEGCARIARVGAFTGVADGATSLWALSLRGPGNAPFDASADGAELSTVERDGSSATFTWTVAIGGAKAVVRAAVNSDAASGLSHWSLTATVPDGWRVVETVFPRVKLALADGMKLAVPTSWGLEKAVEPGLHYDEAYPSWGATMQFVAAYDTTGGVYLATHDRKANHKAFRANADEAGLTLECAHFPAVVEGDFALPYEVTLAGYDGTYMEAAGIYREFALTAPWAAAGPVSKRAIPQWLLDTELWLKPGETPWTDDDAECIAATKANIESCRQAKAYFDVPISLHWYRWHKIPYDTLYPEYFPTKQGFADGVKEAQEAGFRVMPYINGRLCDPESETWKNAASGFAARDAEGNPYTEVYGSKVPLNVMCPTTPYWQTTVSGLVKRLTDEVGVDGVYIDQIACAKAERCFADGHGHTPGGGTHWVDGYRTLLTQARGNLKPDGMLTSEECIECWMDLLDAHLVLNSPCNEGEMIPLFPAVYSGYTVTFGFQYFPPGEPVHSLGFRSKVVRAFLWGSQLGWIDAARLMEAGAESDRELLRNLCHARKDAHDFLQFGRFLGPVEVKGDNPGHSAEAPGSFGGAYTLNLEGVMATAWRAEDGRTAVAICNLDDEEHAVTVDALGSASALTLAAREARVIVE